MTPSLAAPVDLASQLHAARVAQPLWAEAPLAARAAVIAAAARALATEAPALAPIVAATTGRPPSEVWAAEIVPTLDAIRWLAREGARCLAETPLRRSRLQWYLRATRHRLCWEPHGLVGVITPGNALLFLSVPQVAAALLAGNAVAWKPAPQGATVALHAAALFEGAGLPRGLLQVAPGGAAAARAVVEAGVDKLFFTGGSEAGLELFRLQAGRGRPAVLELSGQHVAVVLADADPAVAAAGILWSKLDNGGRNCLSAQLALVERAALPALLGRLRAAIDARPAAGAPGGAAGLGARLDGFVADALARGAHVAAGGAGRPLVLADTAPGMRVVEEEIQGPILALAGIDSEEQAVAWVNRRPHRLSASLWSRDVRRARRLARRLDVGQVWINEELHPAAQPEAALAGRGASGFGASRGRAGLMEMAQPKVISETPLRARRRHYGPPTAAAADMLGATVRLGFAPRVRQRVSAAAALVKALAALARRG